MVSLCICNVCDLGSVRSEQAIEVLFMFSIGDWYPERNLFQILIALTSGLC